MSVFRVEKAKDFTVMSNYHQRDKSLSLRVKGLLSVMLSLPCGYSEEHPACTKIKTQLRRMIVGLIVKK